MKDEIQNLSKQINCNNLEDKYKTKHGEGLKMLIRKQMLQRLPIAQVKARNTSENLLNQIR